VHAPSEEKTDDSKDSSYEESEKVFDQFPKYHMKFLLGDFNAKVGRDNIFKSTIGNESLRQDSNDNGVRIVNFATSKNLVVNRGVDCDTDHYLVVAKVSERLAVSKQITQKFDGKRFNLRKLNVLEVRKQYQIEITNRFAASENLSDDKNINRAWENIK